MYEVPAALFAEAGLRIDGAASRSYRCDDASAALLPLAEVRGPVIAPHKRGLDRDRLRAVITGTAAGSAMPPVPVYREPGEPVAVLLDGAHRFAVSIAYGYQEIPCRMVTRQAAEGSYGFPDGQR